MYSIVVSTLESSKGNLRNLKKLNKKRGLPTEESIKRDDELGIEEEEESASGDGPDMLLAPDAPPEESLVLDVLEKEAKLDDVGERTFPKKKRSKIFKPEQVNEAEYLVRTE